MYGASDRAGIRRDRRKGKYRVTRNYAELAGELLRGRATPVSGTGPAGPFPGRQLEAYRPVVDSISPDEYRSKVARFVESKAPLSVGARSLPATTLQLRRVRIDCTPHHDTAKWHPVARHRAMDRRCVA